MISPIRLEIYKHLFASVAEEMGIVLHRASYSPNIKERRDYSCAIFDAQGKMVSQAAHIPVHLGSMPLSVESCLIKFMPEPSDKRGVTVLSPGDTYILNDPFSGGTHLPDITMVSPVFVDRADESKQNKLIGFVANRAHHADVGGMTPGSMPVAQEIYQEGLIIPPVKLFDRGQLNQALWETLLANVRTPQERSGDLWAQISANHRGIMRLYEMTQIYGLAEIAEYMQALQDYTKRMSENLLESLPNGVYSFTDYLDDDGFSQQHIPITVTLTIFGKSAIVDFSGSAIQQRGSINAVYAITLSAVYYVFRSLLGLDVPNNAGCLEPITVIAPPGTVVNASPPAAVAAGNVETSQRIVDVLLGALAQACPDKIPAASQGTMNNLTIGGKNLSDHAAFTYYETIGGGTGAGPGFPGSSGVHSHMTNTLNTPVEALEFTYPMQVLRYALRPDSGGQGQYSGGQGIIREIQMLVDAQATIISERRRLAPFGLAGGGAGKEGQNLLIRNGQELPLPGKGNIQLNAGDVISIQTPGGGGFGKSSK